ncbi:MAG: hypothetical protein WBP79_01400 [Candidatus Acidiferrales bacterium]
MSVEPKQAGKPRETMGFERPLNILLLGVLFLATWAFWSLRAAAILLGLLIAATLVGVWFRRVKQ